MSPKSSILKERDLTGQDVEHSGLLFFFFLLFNIIQQDSSIPPSAECIKVNVVNIYNVGMILWYKLFIISAKCLNVNVDACNVILEEETQGPP